MYSCIVWDTACLDTVQPLHCCLNRSLAGAKSDRHKSSAIAIVIIAIAIVTVIIIIIISIKV